MTVHIGYYIGHQGTGHLNRAFCFYNELFANKVDFKLYIFTHKHNIDHLFRYNTTIIPIPAPEYTGKQRSCYEDYYPNIKEIVIPVVKACLEYNISTFVCDVNIEVANAVRPLVDRLITICLHGTRDDLPHVNVFALSDRVIAPFSSRLGDHYTNSIDNLKYSGGFIKTQYLPVNNTEVEVDYDILILLGKGGDVYDPKYHKNCPRVLVLGKDKSVADPSTYIKNASIVIGNAGNSIVHEVSYYNKPFICMPEFRPYDEQYIKAQILHDNKYALLSSWSNSLKLDVCRLQAQRNKQHLVKPSAAKYYMELILND